MLFSTTSRSKSSMSRIMLVLIAMFAMLGLVFLSGCSIDECELETSNENAIDMMSELSNDYSYSIWNESTAPNYYLARGSAIQSYDIPRDNAPHYGELDSLGRATWGAIYITPAVWAKESSEGREEGKLPDPVGYKGNNKEVNVKLFTGDTYHGWFYNRSHLIADSLGGDPIKENLVTGTRMQNVGTNNQGNSGYGGMAYAEEMARNYMSLHPNGTVYYSATPTYATGDLLPRSVFVDIKSDDGELNYHIEVFNAQKGYDIDYTTGKWVVTD